MEVDALIEKFIQESLQRGICPACLKPLNKKFAFPVCLNPSCPAHPVNNCIGNAEIEIAEFKALYETIVKNAMNERR